MSVGDISAEAINRIAAERAMRPATGKSRSARLRHRRKLGLRMALLAIDPAALVAAGYLASEHITDRTAITNAAQAALNSTLKG